MQCELSDILREINHERVCVKNTYEKAPAYRDAVLEGLRLAEVIAKSSANSEYSGTQPTANNSASKKLLLELQQHFVTGRFHNAKEYKRVEEIFTQLLA